VAFRDLADFLVVEPLVLTIRGKEYAFPGSVSGDTWARFHAMTAAADEIKKAKASGAEPDQDAVLLSDSQQDELTAEMFGGVEKEMLADGCTSAEFDAVWNTLFAFHLYGRTYAEITWENSGEPPAPNRATRRAAAKPTRSRGSHASKTSPESKATGARGRKSSSSGT
jgi:hypothetical protein